MTTEEARRILNIHDGATEAEIKKAYRVMALKYHPDRNPSADAKMNFIEIHDAYELLMSPSSTDYYSSKSTDSTTHHTARSRQSHHRRTQYQWGNQTDFNKRAEQYTKEEWDAKYNSAREAYNKAFEKKSQMIYAQFFNDYMSGWKRKFMMFVAVISFIFAFIFTLDYTLPRKEVIVEPKFEMDFDKKQFFLLFDDIIIEISGKIFYRFFNDVSSISYDKSTIFQDVTNIKLTGLHQKNAEDFKVFNPLYYFPLFQIILLIPILTFFFEKPTFNFVFYGIHFNSYVIPIIIIYLMYDSNRLLKLVSWIGVILEK